MARVTWIGLFIASLFASVYCAGLSGRAAGPMKLEVDRERGSLVFQEESDCELKYTIFIECWERKDGTQFYSLSHKQEGATHDTPPLDPDVLAAAGKWVYEFCTPPKD